MIGPLLCDDQSMTTQPTQGKPELPITQVKAIRTAAQPIDPLNLSRWQFRQGMKNNLVSVV
jgi:hypothetical protein